VALHHTNGQTGNEAIGLETGDYWVQVTDAHGCELELTLTILGVNDELLSRIRVFPNPSDGLITIDNPAMATLEMLITDLTGAQVFSSTTNQSVHHLDIRNLSKGPYILRISNPSGDLQIVRIALH
jgi:hypothetical protein